MVEGEQWCICEKRQSFLGHEDRDAGHDFDAVQRGDPEMEQKLHRVIRSCAECGDANPVLSIHDQGAGGNGMSISCCLSVNVYFYFFIVYRTVWMGTSL